MAGKEPLIDVLSQPMNLTTSPPDMPFIFINGSGKAAPEKRQLIRHHVMLGKNLGKTYRSRVVGRKQSPDLDDRPCPEGPPGLLIKMRYPIPKKVGSEHSFTHFAVDAEQPLMQDLMKCIVALLRPAIRGGDVWLTRSLQSPSWRRKSCSLWRVAYNSIERRRLKQCGSIF